VALASQPELERELDRLYGLPLDDFTAARDELAKRAREEGERALAARIKELRKPTVSAWAINRLAREHELDLQRLLKAGERLTQTQLEAIAGKDAQSFLEARRDENNALAILVKAARTLLEREGRGTAVLERIGRTLRAAATTEEGRQLLKQGRLSQDIQSSGFDALAALRPADQRTKRQGAKRRDARAEHARATAEARARLGEAKKVHHALSRDKDAADREAKQAERRAAELRSAAEKLGAELEAAARATADAETTLRELEGKQ
jgi:hypothetical protein